MNKKFLIFLVIIFTFFTKAFSQTVAEEIILAPIVCYDENNKTISLAKNPNKALYENLKEYWFEGLIEFSLHKDKEYIYTILDAQKLCIELEKKYVIYGYVQKKEKSWFANLRIYDSNKKEVVKEFFASDEINNFDRCIKSLESNLIDGIEELLGLKFLEKVQETIRPIEIRIPSSLSYWTPIGKWNNVIIGTIGVNTGVEIFPPFKTKIFNNYLVDFSGTLKLSYGYGVGSTEKYPLNYHTLTVAFPITTYIHFDNKHCGYVGTGFFYELEFLNVQKKYENTTFSFQNMFGVEFNIGYEFSLNEKCSLYSETEFNFHIKNDDYICLKQSFGARFRIYKEMEK